MVVFIIKLDIAILSRDIAGFGGFITFTMLDILGFMKKSGENARVLLGRRIRSLRSMKGWTQQELGEWADVNYKFLGEIERGQQNPSFEILVKIAGALEVRLPELFRFEHEILNRKQTEGQIRHIIESIPDEDLRQILSVLRILYPVH